MTKCISVEAKEFKVTTNHFNDASNDLKYPRLEIITNTKKQL